MASTVKLSDLIPSRFVHLTPPNEENIERIKDDLLNGSKILLNNPHVFKNEAGKYEILAGHDRVEAARRAGWTEVPVRDFRAGLNTDDAIFAHFCKENLLRKDVSKAAIAGAWLKRHPEWSDGKVAAESGCTPEHVGETRAVLVASGNIQLVSSRVGLDGKTRESTRTPRQPRQPKKGPLAAKPTTPPAKPQSREDQLRAQREAEAEARERAAKEAKRSDTASEPGEGSTDEDRTEGHREPDAEHEVPEASDSRSRDEASTDALGTSGVGINRAEPAVTDRHHSVSEGTALSGGEGIAAEVAQPSFAWRVLASIQGLGAIRTFPSPTKADLLALDDGDAEDLLLLSMWLKSAHTRRKNLLAQPEMQGAA